MKNHVVFHGSVPHSSIDNDGNHLVRLHYNREIDLVE